MGDGMIAKGEELTMKAEKKLQGWGIFGSKHEDAAQLFHKAANCFKLAKSWNLAGATYVKLASCYIKVDSSAAQRFFLMNFASGLHEQLDITHEAANAYADAAHCYKKDNIEEAVPCLQQSVNLFLELGRLNMAARYYKEIAELYEQVRQQNEEQIIAYYEKAAELFQREDNNISAKLCRQKIALFAAVIEQYSKAIEIYEDIARQSLKNNSLKNGVKRYLLNAGICRLCKGDVVAINNALDIYRDLDPTFSGTREYRLLVDLVAAFDEKDDVKVMSVLDEYDNLTHLLWRNQLIFRAVRAWSPDELNEYEDEDEDEEEDDLT